MLITCKSALVSARAPGVIRKRATTAARSAPASVATATVISRRPRTLTCCPLDRSLGAAPRHVVLVSGAGIRAGPAVCRVVGLHEVPGLERVVAREAHQFIIAEGTCQHVAQAVA